jgi:hypothetical protein
MSILDRRQFLDNAGIAALAAALPNYGLSLPLAATGLPTFRARTMDGR